MEIAMSTSSCLNFISYCLILFTFITHNISGALVSIDLDSNFMKGITISEWNADILIDDTLRATIKKTQSIGANWIALSPSLLQINDNSSDIQFWNNNITDIERDFDYISDFIDYVHDLNFKVMLKPAINTEVASVSPYINPTDVDEWFDNYNIIITQYANLAQKTGVEILSIGSELSHISKRNYNQYWISIINEIRDVYAGKLTYSSLFDEYKQIMFWDKLDYIGINAYFALASDMTQLPSLDVLKIGWQTQLELLNEWKQNSNFSEMNIIFTEVGYPSVNLAPFAPQYTSVNCSDDVDEVGWLYVTNVSMQAMCYQALFAGLSSDIGKQTVNGMFLFWIDTPETLDTYDVEYGNGELYECFYTPRGKPAWDVLEVAYTEIEMEENNGVQAWEIVLICIGCIVGCIVIGVVVFLIYRRRQGGVWEYSIMMQNV